MNSFTDRRRRGAALTMALVAFVVVALIAWPGPSAAAAPVLQGDGGIYVVQRGDTLTGIAARLGVSAQELVRVNGLRNVNFVWVGQRLIIPGGNPPQPGPAASTHVVQRGEALAWIATRYGVTLDDLVRANGLRNPNFIWVGQVLTIPGSTPTPAPTAVPTATPTAAPTAAPTAVPTATPTAAPTAAPTAVPTAAPTAVPTAVPTAAPTAVPTAAPNPYPTADLAATPAPTATPPAQASIHIVQAGESLAQIAARYGTTVAALAAANKLSNPDLIYVGQRLKVSEGGAPLPEPTPGAAPIPAPAPGAGGGRWIDVNLSWQRLTAYEGNVPVFSTAISGGLPGTPTVVGTFAVQTKLVSQAMSGPGYYLPNVPYVMYFYAGYAIHGAYWHNNFGHPMSHGCVNVSIPASAWLFGWASVGTPVVTHW